MSLRLNNIYLSIIGKPNSGKSTLFNLLLGKNISPVGDEYGLTKILYEEKFKYKEYNFIIVDTPGLRRRNKVIEENEKSRNAQVLKLMDKVDVIILLIDSKENLTKQDFRLADLSINRNKMLFFIFNKFDTIENKKEFKRNIKKFLTNSYSKYKMVNIDFISAKYNKKISNVLNNIIKKDNLLSVQIQKTKLNKFLKDLDKKSSYPKIGKISVKPKYIVQLKNKLPNFKVFINTKNKIPSIFQRYFDNEFRKYFKLDGIPIKYEFISSKNPYTN